MARLLTPLMYVLLLAATAAAQPRVSAFEWWVDGDFDTRQTAAGPTLDAQLDMSALGEGLHSIGLRAVQQSDNDTRYSPALLRHFLVPGKAAAGDNRLTRYEWWIDGDFEHRASAVWPAGGVVDLDLDLSAAGEGLHSLWVRVLDANGGVSGALQRHFLVPGKAAAGDNSLTRYEWWIDGDFEHRASTAWPAGGVVDLDLDLSAAGEGLHSLWVRVLDANGRVSGALQRHFLVPGKAAAGDNRLTRYEWWIDGDFEHRASAAWPTGGVVDLDLDLSAVTTGVHTLTYRVTDAAGTVSPAMSAHFLVPDLNDLPAEDGRKIVAYGYWFNAMPIVKIDITPAPTVTIDNNAIPLNNIVPNAIKRDNYRFDGATERVIVTDDVLFGARVFNDLGVASTAVNDTLKAFDVVVDPHLQALAAGTSVNFDTPATGHINGFRYDGYEGDNLQVTLEGADAQLDIVDEQGNVLTATKTVDGDRVTYSVEALTDKTYVLVYDASGELTGNTVSLNVYINGDINNDRLVDVSDLSAVINAVLGRDDPNIVTSPDLNHDGMIDVSDVAIEINLILGSPRNNRRR